MTISSRVSNHSHVMSCSDSLLRSTSILPFDLYWFCVLARALLHFLDSDKFKSKEQFTEHYKNLSSFDEKEVCCNLLMTNICCCNLSLIVVSHFCFMKKL